MRIAPKITRNGLISALASTDDVVMKTHTSRGRDLFTLSRRLSPIDPDVCARLIAKGILVPSERGLLGDTDAQTYRLAAAWGGSAQLQAAE